jgi:transcriptional regulator with XRE-family HTH domain
MISIAQKLKTARERSGMTQEALAAAAGGLSQAQISMYERGLVKPVDEVAERILRAAKPRPATLLSRHASRIDAIARRHSVTRVAVAVGEEGDNPTLVVTMAPTARPYDLSGFAVEVEDLLDAPLAVISEADAHGAELERLVAAASPLVPDPGMPDPGVPDPGSPDSSVADASTADPGTPDPSDA